MDLKPAVGARVLSSPWASLWLDWRTLVDDRDGTQLDLLSATAPVVRMHLHVERSDGQGWTVWVNRKTLWAAKWEGGTTYPGLTLDELSTLLDTLAQSFAGGGNHA